SVEAAAFEDETAQQRPGAVQQSRKKAAAALNGKILRAEARISMTLLHRLILGSDGVVDHHPIERGGRRPANDALVHRIVGELRIAAAEQTQMPLARPVAEAHALAAPGSEKPDEVTVRSTVGGLDYRANGGGETLREFTSQCQVSNSYY